MVPLTELLKERTARQAAEDALTTVKEQLSTVGGEHTTALKAITDERDAAVSTLQGERLDMDVDRALIAEKIGEKGIGYFRHEYSQVKVEEGQERPAFGDWFKTYKEANPAFVAAFQVKGDEVAKVDDAAAVAALNNGGGSERWSWERRQTKTDPANVAKVETPENIAPPDHVALRDMSEADFDKTLAGMNLVEQPRKVDEVT